MSTAILIAGLGFGDEGKGATVDWLTRTTGAHTVVRYNGGAQAGHNVVTADGRHHTFSQFGAGTFAGAKTHLSRHMLVNPIFLLSEGKHLLEIGEKDVYDRLTVDEGALVTNPFQVSANRIREMARNEGRHGSCGMGIGETVADSLAPETPKLYVNDLSKPGTTRTKLAASRKQKMMELVELHLKDCPVSNASWNYMTLAQTECSCPFKREWEVIVDETTVDLALERYAEFVARVRIVRSYYLSDIMREGTTIFEGAQGMLLDQDYGFHPYTTWTDITFGNADDLLAVQRGWDTRSEGDVFVAEFLESAGFKGEVRRIGVLRSYHTRHGAGPFPTEDASLDNPEPHNANGPWQHGFRQGHFDLCLARYAVAAIGGIDELHLTHLDRIQNEQKVCVQYDSQGHIMHEPYHAEMWEWRNQLDVREGATKRMMGYKPVYRTLQYSPEGFATEIAKHMGVKIGSLAYGPTSEDRRTL